MFLDDNSILRCDFTSAPFLDQDHNVIIKSNLKTNANNKLHKLAYKGPKYRENRTADYEKAYENIITGIKLCIQSWCDKHGVFS